MKRDADALAKLFASLDEESRNSLFDYAEFLHSRSDGAIVQHPGEPRDVPRLDDETVVGAIKRMKQTYPMIDSMKVFAAASNLMSEHMVSGRDADEVIEEIERIFDDAYRELLKDFQ